MSETHKRARNLQRIGAVLAGLVITVILSLATDLALRVTRIYQPGNEPMYGAAFLLLATTYRCIYSVAGPYISARLAPDKPR